MSIDAVVALVLCIGAVVLGFNIRGMIQRRQQLQRPRFTLTEARRDEIRQFQELIGQVQNKTITASDEYIQKRSEFYARFPKPSIVPDNGSNDSNGGGSKP